MFEKCDYLTLVKGGQKKEDQSQQIPTFRCSEWSILMICILEIFLLSPHRGDVASTCPGHCLSLYSVNGANDVFQTPAF